MVLHRVVHRLAVRFPALGRSLDIRKRKATVPIGRAEAAGPESNWAAMGCAFRVLLLPNYGVVGQVETGLRPLEDMERSHVTAGAGGIF